MGAQIVVTNRLLLPPDGLTFVLPANGMLGIAQVRPMWCS